MYEFSTQIEENVENLYFHIQGPINFLRIDETVIIIFLFIPMISIA